MSTNDTANSQLAQRIADLCTSTYEGIKTKAAKPIIRLNGIAEWTILAGLVAIEGEKLTLITLATGMKTMPNEIRQYSSGLIVHDLHAEILCLRMFNWWLMQEVKQQYEELRSDVKIGKKRKCLFENESEMLKKSILHELPQNSREETVSDGTEPNDNGSVTKKTHLSELETTTDDRNSVKSSIQANDEKGTEKSQHNLNKTISVNKTQTFRLLTPKNDDNAFNLRPGIKLALFISEPPCGDASMSSVAKGEPWKEQKEEILRGRANFSSVGKVRTKPGRSDSKVSYSKSCSDKLCLKQFTGVLNAINSLCIEPLYLLYLVVPNERSLLSDLNRCFRERLDLPNINDSLTHPLQFLLYEEEKFSHRKHGDKSSPLPLSFAYCDLDKTGQVLQNGVKNGAYVKNRAPAFKGASILSRRVLWNQAKEVIGDFENYSSIKNENSSRTELKKTIRRSMGLWPESTPENFPL